MNAEAQPLEIALDLLEAEKFDLAAEELKSQPSEDVAFVLERAATEHSVAVLIRLPDLLAGEALVDASTEPVKAIVAELPDDYLARILDILPMDDASELRDEVGESRFERLLEMIPEEDAGEIERLLSYPEDSVAREITEHFFRVRPTDTMNDVLADLRAAKEDDYESVSELYVISDSGVLKGVFSLRKGLRADPTIPVSELMNTELIAVSVQETAETAARRMAKYGFYGLPVLDEAGRMVGLFMGDDAQEIIEEADSEDQLKLGAVSGPVETYISLSVWQLARRRLPWLAALFVAETFTGMVMRHYGQSEELSLVPLTFFIPLLIGAGGNTGSQVTTTLTRALALGEVTSRDWFLVLRREVLTALLIGAALGVIGYVRALYGWNTSPELSMVIGIALPSIVLWAGLVGSLLPLAARRLGIDPAVMSAPFITTFVDATGLVIYFEIARRILPI